MDERISHINHSHLVHSLPVRNSSLAHTAEQCLNSLALGTFLQMKFDHSHKKQKLHIHAFPEKQ